MRWIAGALVATALAISPAPTRVDADSPFSAPLHRLSAELVDRDTLRLVLATERIPERLASRVSGQLLVVGGVPMPTASGSILAEVEGDGAVSLDVVVPAVPSAVLDLPLEDIPLRWQGLDRRGRVVVDVHGRITLGEGGNAVALESQAARDLVRLVDHTVRLRGLGVATRLLVRLHNPMGFEVTVARVQYVVSVGGMPLVSGERPGFRLRPVSDGDVLIEAEVPLVDLAAGAAAAVIQRLPMRLDGVVWLRTPAGDRPLPLAVTTAVPSG